MIFQKIELKNNYILEILKTIEENLIPAINSLTYFDEDKKTNAKKYISEEYCHKIISKGRDHQGRPEAEYQLSVLNSKHFSKLEGWNDTLEPLIFSESIKLQEYLSSTNQALFAYYPPEGYLAWHNNADAHGYNVLFTWSETGDGWFGYKDDNGNTVKVKDKKGWSCKMMYFPSYDDKEKTPFYHAAYTKCKRITMAFRFEDAKHIWNDLMEDLTNE